jgi:hypothetical protein
LVVTVAGPEPGSGPPAAPASALDVAAEPPGGAPVEAVLVARVVPVVAGCGAVVWTGTAGTPGSVARGSGRTPMYVPSATTKMRASSTVERRGFPNLRPILSAAPV